MKSNVAAPARENAGLREARKRIASRVRELRKARRLAQAELARHLGLSQNRLSEIERGDGSFTAEQFLVVLALFNVPTTYFAAATSRADALTELQDVLARLGARHLGASDLLASERIASVDDAIREVLLAPEAPRLVTALAPVVVTNVNDVSLERLKLDLAQVGREWRLGWVLASTLAALRAELAAPLPRDTTRSYRRAETVLGDFLSRAFPEGGPAPPRDVLDRSIRTRTTPLTASMLEAETRWGIVTSLTTADFVRALRESRS